MEQNNFQWTDETVKEFMSFYVENPFNSMEQFKASKTKPKEYEILSFRNCLFGKAFGGWFAGAKEVGSNETRSEDWMLKNGYKIN